MLNCLSGLKRAVDSEILRNSNMHQFEGHHFASRFAPIFLGGGKQWIQAGDPKGPFRTKNTTTIVKIVNYYAAVFLLRPPNLLRRGPFLERKNVCNSQESGVRTRCAAIVNHPAVLKILRVVNLLRVVFLVRRGPLGFCNNRRNCQRNMGVSGTGK